MIDIQMERMEKTNRPDFYVWENGVAMKPRIYMRLGLELKQKKKKRFYNRKRVQLERLPDLDFYTCRVSFDEKPDG
jgi:hypothetical protein